MTVKSSRRRAWIVDVDGTLALRGDRSPYDMTRVAEDLPNGPVVQCVQALASHPLTDAVIIVSGRDESARRATELWLTFHQIPWTALHMRPLGDTRADTAIKRDIFTTQIQPRYDVLGVLDDRDGVVALWRELGLTCFQVAPGDF